MSFIKRFISILIAATGIAGAAFAAAPAPALLAKVNAAIDADTARLTAIFKDIHQNPEIGFTETRTAAIIARELNQLGFNVTTGIGKTGVVGVFANGPGKTLWFRADMDANGGVREATGLAYASTRPQRLADGSEVDTMHACGHDAHVTWLLGLAKAMVALKSEWSGTLVVYGQPAEEVGLGRRRWSRMDCGIAAFQNRTLRSPATPHLAPLASFRTAPGCGWPASISST